MFYNQKIIFSFLFLKIENRALFDNYYLKQISILEILQNKNKKQENVFDNKKLFSIFCFNNKKYDVFK